MSSYRISVNEIDRSASAVVNIGSTGAMVVRSQRGDIEPIFISTGQEQRILDAFGIPDANFPDVIEAIEFNKQAPLWMNTVYTAATDTHGAVIVTTTEVVGYEGADGTATTGAGDLQQVTSDLTDSAISTFAFTATSPHELFVLYTKSPATSDFQKIGITYDGTTGAFLISLYLDRNGVYEIVETYEVSIIPGATNGYGEDIYIENVFQDNEMLGVILNPDAVASEFLDYTSPVAFTGSVKDNTVGVLDTLVPTVGWTEYYVANKYPAKIFMDVTGLATISPVFETLRNTYQKYSSYILALPLATDIADVLTTYSALSLNNRGLAVYWNWGLVRYNNNKFYSPLTGRAGRKYAQMINVYNGLAPCWIDENNHGGQLGSGVLEMKYNPIEDNLQSIETGGVNPIIFDPSFGVMITGQKTAKTAGFLSDDSYIGHSRLFDTIIENIVNQVLTAQITKLNDEIHRRKAVMLGRSIVKPLTEPILGLLNDFRIKCDNSNNDAIAKSQKKFVFSLAVQVTPFSEFIVFNFIKTGQQLTVDSVLA